MKGTEVITKFDGPEDMSPEMKAYCEHLRVRAQAQGCVCRPVITIDTAKRVTVIEHAEECPAWLHPSGAAASN